MHPDGQLPGYEWVSVTRPTLHAGRVARFKLTANPAREAGLSGDLNFLSEFCISSYSPLPGG